MAKEEIESEAEFLARLRAGAQRLDTVQRRFVVDQLGVEVFYRRDDEGRYALAVQIALGFEPHFLVDVETGYVTELRRPT